MDSSLARTAMEFHRERLSARMDSGLQSHRDYLDHRRRFALDRFVVQDTVVAACPAALSSRESFHRERWSAHMDSELRFHKDYLDHRRRFVLDMFVVQDIVVAACPAVLETPVAQGNQAGLELPVAQGNQVGLELPVVDPACPAHLLASVEDFAYRD
jgi:uncharacterized short protein YbdD (DUF466 family)